MRQSIRMIPYEKNSSFSFFGWDVYKKSSWGDANSKIKNTAFFENLFFC